MELMPVYGPQFKEQIIKKMMPPHNLGCKAGLGYSAFFAHACQFKRMRKMIKRQRTIIGRLQREVGR